MSKATWEDTPFYRRLLARLKKDLPSGGAQFVHLDGYDSNALRGGAFGCDRYGNFDDFTFGAFPSANFFGCNGHATGPDQFDAWDGASVENEYLEFNETQSGALVFNFKRPGLWWTYIEMDYGPTVDAQVDLRLPPGAPGDASGAPAATAPPGASFVAWQGLFWVPAVGDFFSPSYSVHNPGDSSSELSTHDAAIHPSWMAAYVTPVQVAPAA